MTDDVLPTGRRERKRRSTRMELAAAALDLFEERGFSATTIEDITERADVSRRTFFRHFATKESVLLPGIEDYESQLVAALDKMDPPIAMSDMLAALVDVSARMDLDDDHQHRRAAVIAENRLHLGGAAWDAFVSIRDTIVHHVAARVGLATDDHDVDLMVTMVMFSMSITYARWIEGGDTLDLPTELDLTIQQIRALVADEICLGSPPEGGDG